MWNLAKAFFQRKILFCLGLMIVYTLGIIVFLSAVNLWNASLVKDTILWFLFSGFVLLVVSVTSKDTGNIFWKTVADNTKLVLLLEFIVNTYTFSLFLELLLVPAVAVIAMVDTVARLSRKDAAIAKLTGTLQAMVGLLILGVATYKAVSDYQILGSMSTIRSVLLAPLLSILFSPFIYLTLIVSTYELLFVRIDLGPTEDVALKRYAKRRILWHCGVNLKKLHQIAETHAPDLAKITCRQDVDNLLISQVPSQRTNSDLR